MIRILFIVIIFSISLHAQKEWQRWGEAKVSYQLPEAKERDYSIKTSNVAAYPLYVLRNGYWFLISDLDGDLCPFNPTCSSFFMEAVQETNILQGTLMFADRFTRDINVFNRDNKYPMSINNKLFDPVSNYKLKRNLIIYSPPKTFVKFENE